MLYRLCDQTVTLYQQTAPDSYTRTVLHGVHLDWRKNHNIDKTGEKDANSFLLVVPTNDPGMIKPGDKVRQGEHPAPSTREEWAELIPSKVPGLVVVKYVDPKYRGGKCVHIEAGG